MKKAILSILFALYAILVHSFSEINFRVLDVKANLSDNYVQDILHDKYGFMWFATRDGLSRYDGYHFRNYTTLQLGSYDNCIDFAKEDASGTIWIKTPVNYCYYNREKDELDNRVQTPLSLLGIPEVPKQIFVDEEQNLWCVVDNTLYTYRFAQKELLQLSIPVNVGIVALVCRGFTPYLLLTDGNVVTIDWAQRSIRKVVETEPQVGFQPRIYLDAAYNLWVYSLHDSDIKCYSTQEQKWINFLGKSELNSTHTTMTTVIDDGKGSVWIGTDNRGVFIYHYKENSYTWLSKEPSKLYTLPNNHVTSIFKDGRDVMWIGTGKQGVAYAKLSHTTFENISSPQKEDVSCLLEDGRGNLWFGYDGEGIARYNKESKRYTYYKSRENAIPSDLIVSSFLDSKGRAWFGSFGGGAFYYQDGKFFSLSSEPKIGEVEIPHYVRRITEDAHGNIWFATYTQGVFCLEATGELTCYNMNNSTLLTNYIADLSCDDQNRLYIVTGAAIYYMNLATRQLTQMQSYQTGEEVTLKNFTNCIYQDSRGLVWLGGRKGVSIYNPHSDSSELLTSEDGLSHPHIRAIVEDKRGNMWLSTDHGITHIRVGANEAGMTYSCYPYFEEDGMAHFTLNNFSILCNDRDEILVGGSGGYIKIKSEPDHLYYYDKKIVFTDLYLGNERVEVGKATANGKVALQKNIQLTPELWLDYSDSNFSIEVSAMDYSNLHKIVYLYRLSSKEEWVKLDGNRVYFNKLAPGSYSLQVKVAEGKEGESNQIATLVIHVKPPFWQSTLAYFSYLLLFLLVLALFVVRTKQKHKRILTQQRNEMKAAHQHEVDEAKLRFFTNVNHDLRTPLSLIIIPLEKILHSEAAVGVRKELTLIHRNAVTLLNVVNQLLDLRKLENGKAQLNASHGDLAHFVKGVCDSFESYADKKGIQLNLMLKCRELETNFDRNKMERILLNLLSNAFKYNCEEGSVTVTLNKITVEGSNYASIQVADTGIGISDENKEKIFDRFFQEEFASTAYVGSGIGMHIVHEYVQLHGGEITIRDNQPQGTIVEIVLPIGCNEKECEMPIAAVEESMEAAVTAQHSPILVVEDNDDFRNFLVDSLKEYYQVFEAANGQEALTVLQEQEVKLVVSDIRMPVMDGLALCHAIKHDIKYSHIPVLLLTARSAEEHVLEGLREDADDYLTKPFNLEILLLRIAKLLQWSNNNHKQFGTIDISPSDITVSTLDEKLIEQAIQAVEENMDNSEFSVEDLSAVIGMSRGHLYKKLMTITGKSPIEFIRVLRIKRGKALLEQSQESISQIAYRVGLSPKSFSKYFKEEFGCLPSEYTKKDS